MNHNKLLPFFVTFLSATTFSRFEPANFFALVLLVLDEYEESDSEPLDEPEPDELDFFLRVAP